MVDQVANKPIRRRRWLRWLIGLAALLVVGFVFCLPWPRYLIWGLVRQESFYQGMPSSYWRDAINNAGQAGVAEQALDKLRFAMGRKPDSRQTWIILMDGDPHSLGVLDDLLEDSDPRVRALAANGIGNVAARAHDEGATVPALAAFIPRLMRLVEENDTAHPQAMFALGQIGPEARAAIPLLEKGLEDEQPRRRMRFAQALWGIEPRHEAAFTVLLEGLKSEERILRSNAVDGLRFQRGLKAPSDEALLVMRQKGTTLLPALRSARDRARLPSEQDYVDRANQLIELIERMPPASEPSAR